MSDIRLGVIAGQFQPVTHLQNISPLWKGPLLLDNSITAPNCWLKAVTLPELILECFGHLLAKEAGSPSLVPIVVTDPKNLLKNPSKYFFATEDADTPSLRQLNAAYPAFQSIYFDALRSWVDSGMLSVLDELLANGDRNAGNLLFDGKAKWIPIDYSRSKASGPAPMPAWDGTEIRLDFDAVNQLICMRALDQKNALTATTRLERARLFIGVLQHFAGLDIPGCEAIVNRLTVWVQDRRNWSLRRLLGNKLSTVWGTSISLPI